MSRTAGPDPLVGLSAEQIDAIMSKPVAKLSKEEMRVYNKIKLTIRLCKDSNQDIPAEFVKYAEARKKGPVSGKTYSRMGRPKAELPPTLQSASIKHSKNKENKEEDDSEGFAIRTVIREATPNSKKLRNWMELDDKTDHHDIVGKNVFLCSGVKHLHGVIKKALVNGNMLLVVGNEAMEEEFKPVLASVLYGIVLDFVPLQKQETEEHEQPSTETAQI